MVWSRKILWFGPITSNVRVKFRTLFNPYVHGRIVAAIFLCAFDCYSEVLLVDVVGTAQIKV